MAKKKQLKKKKRGVGRQKYPGRPSCCDNTPGETACLKKISNGFKKKNTSIICRQCKAPEVREKIKRMFLR